MNWQCRYDPAEIAHQLRLLAAESGTHKPEHSLLVDAADCLETLIDRIEETSHEN